jgi:nondiscriminating glutamyl-tRNA synthetase
MVGDFVVMRSNGLPTYNFACVIDDGLMKISHVIRAEEHLSNTNRQLMLYNTLKFPKPEFAHVSLVMGRDEDGAVSKLSKRHGAASVDQYKEEGFLPAAMINYLTQLGWSHPDGKEVFSLDDLTEKFSIGRIGKSPSIFDIAKLTWMNGVYIKALPDDEFERRVTPFIDESQHHWFLKHPHTYRTDLLRLVKSGLNRLDEINKALEQFVPWKGPHLESDAKEFLVQTPEVKMVLASLHAALTRTPSLESEAVAKALIDQVKAETKTKGKPLMMGIRVGISGQCHGSDLGNLIRFLGREECLRRLQWIQQAF